MMLPIGIDHFGELVRHRNPVGERYLFVDKTPLITSFISAGDKITLITRPRRFGKTLNLSMLHIFLPSSLAGRYRLDIARPPAASPLRTLSEGRASPSKAARERTKP